MPPTARCTNDRRPRRALVELAQASVTRLERALHVGLEHEVERGDLAALDLREDVLEAGAADASVIGR